MILECHPSLTRSLPLLGSDIELYFLSVSTEQCNSMNVCLIARVWHTSFKILPFLAFAGVILFSEGYSVAQRAQPGAEAKNETAISQLRHAASLLQLGRPNEAEPILRQVISEMPQNADAHNLLGIIFDQREQFKDAEREYRAALRLNPDAISPLANLGVLLGRTKRSDEAIKTFETVLQKVPDHPQATLNLGLQYVARADYARAMPLLEHARQLGLDRYEARYNLGLSLFYLNRLDEAAHAFESALMLSPNAAEPYHYLGLISWAGDHGAQAADLWNRALTLRPNFPEANFMLGESLRKNQHASASVEYYRRALGQDPSKFVHYARLGGVYILLRLPDQAREVFRLGVQRFPNLPEAHYFLGIAARAAADYGQAEAELRKSLSLEPHNVNAMAQLGFVLLERDRMAEAETALRGAIAINDKHFYANYDLGRLLIKSRRYEEALPVLQRAVVLKSNNSNVHYQLFMALTRLKRKDEAERELAIFKQLDEARNARSETESDDEDAENPSSTLPP